MSCVVITRWWVEMTGVLLILVLSEGMDRTDKNGEDCPGFGIVPIYAHVLQSHAKLSCFPKAMCGPLEELKQARISVELSIRK